MQIKWEDIKPALVRKVGSGGFAQVYEVYMYGALMAVKIVNLKADQDLNLSEALVRFKCAHDQCTLSLPAWGVLSCIIREAGPLWMSLWVYPLL